MKYLLSILIVIAFYFSVSGQAIARYKILSENCEDNSCYVLVYVSPQNYDNTNMQRLAKDLAAKYKDREIVNLRVFDKKEIIRAYMKGVREPINVGSDSRAYFIHQADCGDMLFYKSKKAKVKLVKVSWNNGEKCNEPFRTF